MRIEGDCLIGKDDDHPPFSDAANGDYRLLRIASPLIDRALPPTQWGLTDVFSGDAQPFEFTPPLGARLRVQQGMAFDLGACEEVPTLNAVGASP
jgi:hypothetical protein